MSKSPRLKISSVQSEANAFLDRLPDHYKVLVVIEDPETGDGWMTNSCCDGCGYVLARVALTRYRDTFAPEHRKRARTEDVALNIEMPEEAVH